MSQTSRISATIPKATADEALNLLGQLQTLLQPYLVTLTTDEHVRLAKMSDKTLAFVTKTMRYTETNKAFIPSFLDVAELKQDFDLVQSLQPVAALADQLHRWVDDTIMLAGSEAYMNALLYYNNVRGASKQGVSGAQAVYEDLSVRFPGPRRKSGPEAKSGS